ncbi:hypothetical protein BJ878DRAFT_489240 [Calycina marina]|uniref:Uncharacterized protein n=1 Tax=Calycina marina TaxID=1763456 RepID=A0A9P7ZAB2_9HELO|nr:hypothetical protein BJ878DRAFT_489240 [Calycina marina]
MNESMDYIPHGEILRKVSDHQGSPEEPSIPVTPKTEQAGFSLFDSSVRHRFYRPNKVFDTPSVRRSPIKLRSVKPIERSNKYDHTLAVQQALQSKMDELLKRRRSQSSGRSQELLETIDAKVSDQTESIAQLRRDVENIQANTSLINLHSDDLRITLKKKLDGVKEVVDRLLKESIIANALSSSNTGIELEIISIQNLCESLLEWTRCVENIPDSLRRLGGDSAMDNLTFTPLDSPEGQILWPQGDEPMQLSRVQCKCREYVSQEYPGANMGWLSWLLHALIFIAGVLYLVQSLPLLKVMEVLRYVKHAVSLVLVQ